MLQTGGEKWPRVSEDNAVTVSKENSVTDTAFGFVKSAKTRKVNKTAKISMCNYQDQNSVPFY